jgi:hypothetical protein
MHPAVHRVQNLPARGPQLLLNSHGQGAAAVLKSRHVRFAGVPRVVPFLEVIQERDG